MMHTQETAILLFSRTTVDEAANKTIAKKTKLNLSVINGLQQHTITEIRKSKLPFFISDENAQKQSSFSEKLKTAANTVFTKGYSKLIIIGNDCPQLSSSLLVKASTELKKGNNIIGPDANGGVYLIGITKKSFASLDFEKINWQTSSVFSNIIKQLDSLPAVYTTLDTLSDINTYSDIISFLNKKLNHISFFRWLKNLFLNVNFRVPHSSSENISLIYLTITTRRGPPHL